MERWVICERNEKWDHGSKYPADVGLEPISQEDRALQAADESRCLAEPTPRRRTGWLRQTDGRGSCLRRPAHSASGRWFVGVDQAAIVRSALPDGGARSSRITMVPPGVWWRCPHFWDLSQITKLSVLVAFFMDHPQEMESGWKVMWLRERLINRRNTRWHKLG